MPSFCCVVDCGMRGERDLVSFFRFPAILKNRGQHLHALSEERRNAWIKALKRGSLSEGRLKYWRVCSRHFINGAPAELENKAHPDWIPSQNMGYVSSRQPNKVSVSRYERLAKRKKLIHETEVVEAESMEEALPCETLVNTRLEQSSGISLIQDSGSFSSSDENADNEGVQDIKEKSTVLTVQSNDQRRQAQKDKPNEDKHITIVTTKQIQSKPQNTNAVELVKSSVYQEKDEQKKKRKDMDEYDVYGELIARKLRNLKTHYARITVQSMLNMVIHEAELGTYNVPLTTSKYNMLYNKVLALPERKPFASTSGYSDPLRVKSALSDSESVSTQHTPFSDSPYFDFSKPPL